jgi:ATP synthase protein I
MPTHKNRRISFRKHREWAENLTLVMQVGLTMAGSIFFCFWVGRYVDRWLGTKGIFVAVFTILGVLGGANTVYRQILKVTVESKNKDKDMDNGVD